MVSLAAGKARTGRALHNPVPVSEGRVTTIDAPGLCCDDEGDRQRWAGLGWAGLGWAGLGWWWWADPRRGLVIGYDAIR